jgi:hypothetical protein
LYYLRKEGTLKIGPLRRKKDILRPLEEKMDIRDGISSLVATA